MTYKTKAECSFDLKMKKAIAERDFERVQHLFHLFGCYLELIEPIPDPDPAPAHQPTGKELVWVPDGEPTVEEEQLYVLSGGFARTSAVIARFAEDNEGSGSYQLGKELSENFIDQINRYVEQLSTPLIDVILPPLDDEPPIEQYYMSINPVPLEEIE